MMVQWAFVNTQKINRIGYNKEVGSLFIDFTGSDIDTAFINVPESLFQSFIEAKSPDEFYDQFVEGYYDIVKLD